MSSCETTFINRNVIFLQIQIVNKLQTAHLKREKIYSKKKI